MKLFISNISISLIENNQIFVKHIYTYIYIYFYFTEFFISVSIYTYS